ncbi:MAG: hypothetical protein JJU11_06845 [Candidatus Sumerlaeia bacterium]|nr:hypothetical protein [Candidatus Sumerlaeia bacterium]
MTTPGSKKPTRRGKTTREANTDLKPLLFVAEEKSALQELMRELWEERIFLLLLVVLAFLTRFWALSQPSLWMDEIALFREAYTGEYSLVSQSAHAFHLKGINLSMQVFGQTEFGLRFFGAFMGALAVPLCYALGRWGGNRMVGIALSLLVLANSFLLVYAQDGNYYGTLTLLSVCGFLVYTLFFRRMPHAAFVLLPLIGYTAYRTHPIALIPFAVITGGMVVGALVFPEIRRRLFEVNPRNWGARPAFPVAIAGCVGVGILAWSRIAQALSEPLSMINLGGSTLTNVDFGWPLFAYHIASFGVNFFEQTSFHRTLLWVPFSFFLAGIALAVALWWRKREPVHLAMAGLGVMLPLASYIILFSIQLDRNFNLRYFIFLVPMFLMMISFAVAAIARWNREDEPMGNPWRNGTFLGFLAPPLILAVIFSANYLLVDKSNFKGGVEYLRDHYKGEPIIAASRNDTVQSRFYLEAHDLPTLPPGFQFLNTPPHANVFAGSLPFMLHGLEAAWIPSAWRFLEAEDLYRQLEVYDTPFRGRSKLGEHHALYLHRWDFGDRVVGTHAAARFQVPESGPDVAVLFMGPGHWQLDGFPESELEIEGRGNKRLLVPANGAELRAVPFLPDSVHLRFDQAISQPEHTRYTAVEVEGAGRLVRSEREGSFDFLVYQPDGPPRQIVVQMASRDENDPVLARNNTAVPPGLLVAVAVNGIHRGYWSVPSGEEGLVRIPLDLELEKGNNRVTISGTLPRLAYTPHFPWLFGGVEWNTTHETPVPSLEDAGRIRVGTGWTSPLPTPTPGSRLPRGWQVTGTRAIVDGDIQGPGGDAAIRVEFPAAHQASVTLLAPHFPVEEGTLVNYWFYMRLSAVENADFTPFVRFVDADGQGMGQAPINGPNMRGDTFGNGWIRRQVDLPVPQGAHYMVPVFQWYPVDGETEGGYFWIASLGSPGIARAMDDPQLPASYFGSFD